MRLLPHILLAFVAIGLQRGLDALLAVGSGRVDLPMIAASFTAACFARTSGPLAAVFIGLAYDLSGAGPMGTYGAALGLGGLVASLLAPPSRWGRLLVALIAGIVVASAIAWALGVLRAAIVEEAIRDRMSFAGALVTMVLSSLMAIALSWPLWKWRRAFVVEPPRL